MAFDADQYLEARQPPSFIFRGREYVGRILSADEWLRLHVRRDGAEQRMQARAKARARLRQEHATAGVEEEFSERTVEKVVRETIAVSRQFTRDCIVSWFPAPWWRRWLGAWFNPAWRAFRQMPDDAQVAAVKDFSESQRKVMPTASQPPGTAKSETRDPRSAT